ncbi:hypothetical protein N0V90_005683 [Kalmusia sp. IMI 367209]|nr:hypothetical protein N0V90_005683 [Kalmusia sp. IMI 367209]
MARPHRFGWPSLVASLLLLLSLFNFAVTSPLPDDHVNNTLVVRRGFKPDFKEALPTITKPQYVTYLKKHYKKTDKYLFYSGGADKKQIPRFMRTNPGYFYYGNMITAPKWKDRSKPPPNHPWYKEFDVDKVEDDGEDASMALATVATGTILVFGAIDYKNFPNSFFSAQEIDILHEGLKTGRITAIHHMAKSARSKDDIIAIEDADGNIVFQPGMEGTENASINCDGTSADSDHTSDEDPNNSGHTSDEDPNNSDHATKRALGKYGVCGPPKIPSKRSPQECDGKKGNEKRAVGSKKQSAACPLKKPTCTPAMKKAGKCGTTKKCTAAMKKAGKCGTKKSAKKTPKHINKKRPATHRKKTTKKRPSRAKKGSRRGRGRSRH